MTRRRRLPRPVRQARKLKSGAVTVSAEAWRRVSGVARAYNVRPETVLGIVVALKFSR